MRRYLPRKVDVLAAHDIAKGAFHTLALAILAAESPGNRFEARAEMRSWPRGRRREYGFGWNRDVALCAPTPGWPEAQGRSRTEPPKVAR